MIATMKYDQFSPAREPSWHFRSEGSRFHEHDAMEAALEDARNRRCDSAIMHLGNSLHPLQDEFSHSVSHEAETVAAHLRATARYRLGLGPHPDDAATWPEDVAATEDATKASLREFLSLPCNLCVQCESTE